jgi:hypothetical protein
MNGGVSLTSKEGMPIDGVVPILALMVVLVLRRWRQVAKGKFHLDGLLQNIIYEE